MNIGIIGCGNISSIYLENCAGKFDNLNIVALADLVPDTARFQAERFGVTSVLTPDELLQFDDVDIVLNLTIPAAHAEVNLKAIAAGKHVYAEKPAALRLEDGIATLTAAAEKGLRFGSAPDTVLGGGIQLCRRIIDAGEIGEVVAANAVMSCHGHESWHPAPVFYYKTGGGPMLDMGPYYLTALVQLVGPMRAVSAMTKKTFPTRTITSEPLNGTIVDVEVNTHQAGSILFENGAIGQVIMSFDTWRSNQPCLEIHGTKGSLSCPDPNTFSGPVQIFREGTGDWEVVPTDGLPWTENSRGIGLSEMASAIEAGTPHRASGEVAIHVLDAMLAFDRASESGRTEALKTECSRPSAMPAGSGK